ncbi:MAG: helix-turn-helix transcriptional regulator [Firmicutes bacterium]|nr:helix-turn-helix transcriptional regulator [Bacillota bacterium]
MTIDKQLGMRISYLRKQAGWSQEELSFRSAINKNYLSDLERGRRNPSLKILERLARAFSLNLATLLKGLESFDE